MKLDTLTARLFLALAGLLALLLALAAVFGELRLAEHERALVDERLASTAAALAGPAADTLAGRSERGAFEARLVDVGRATGLRLTLIAADGSVLADSDVRGALANHADRPEFVAALREGTGTAQRRSATTGEQTYYVVRRLDEGGRVLGAMRAATEEPRLRAALDAFRSDLLLFALAALILGALVAWLFARWLVRPLEAVGRHAAALAAGREETPAALLGPVEVRRLADAFDAAAREVRERARGERRARTELETILASLQEGVVAVDANERVVLMNRAAAQLLGLSAPLGPGGALWEKLRFPELERALRGVLGGEAAWHGSAPAPSRDGRVLSLSIARTPPASAAGAFFGAVVLLSDVTAVRRLEQVRIDFVANVSHELRTPLAAVLAALETLQEPGCEPGARDRFLEIAQRNAARLQAIVADLLELSAIEAEGERMPLERVRVDAPLRTAAAALAGAAEKKRLRLEVQGATGEPALVLGNAQRLERAFTNLLENAIKYTPAGGRVSARVRLAPGEVRVEFEDTGMGIPAAALPRVFERFYRVDPSRSREMGGTGLGLAIVKHVVRAHAGQVNVQSEEGRGTTFTVTLPRAPAEGME